MGDRLRYLNRIWLTTMTALIGIFLMVVGLWEYTVSGAFRLVIMALIILVLVAIAEKQRRVVGRKHAETH